MRLLFVAFTWLFLSGQYSLADGNIAFAKQTLTIGKMTLVVEIADTPEKAAKGLMLRDALEVGTGMLFVFPDEQIRSFWMKNTKIPLDIGFFDKKKTLIDIQTMMPPVSEIEVNLPTYVSKGPAMYALEVPKGWFSKHRIRLKQRFLLK